MSEEAQYRKMAYSIQMLGCPIQLTGGDVQQLYNTAIMRSIWRHLQRHVLPVHTVQTIRINVFLAKLQEENILPGTFGQIKIESVQEFSQLQELSGKKEELGCLNDRIKLINENLESARCSFLTSVSKKQTSIHSIKEIQDKTVFIELKHLQILKDVKNIDKQMEIANCLNICKTMHPPSELEQIKNIVAKCVLKYKVTKENKNDHCIKEIVKLSRDYPISTIYDGILKVSGSGLNGLKRIKTSVETYRRPGPLPVYKQLNSLNLLVIQTDQEHKIVSESLKNKLTELEEKKYILKKLLKDTFIVYNCTFKTNDSDTNDHLCNEFVDKLVPELIKVGELQKLKTSKISLESEFSNLDDLMWQAHSLAEKYDVLLKQVERKVDDVNKCITLICNMKAVDEKAELFQKCRKQASDFRTQLHLEENKEDVFTVLSNLLTKEIELVNNVPMIAITRQWEETGNMLPKYLVKRISEATSSVHLLFPAEPINIFKSILEKILWSLTMDDLFDNDV